MFIRFDRMYERDGHTHTGTHTDTQTPHDSIGRACKASRGKNQHVLGPPKGQDSRDSSQRPLEGQQLLQNCYDFFCQFSLLFSSFLMRYACIKRGLCRHAVSVCLSVCVSVCHVRTFCQNG